MWINSPKFLSKFYRETKPQQSSDSATENDKGYHQNSLINIRGDINRHLSDIEENWDIVDDKAIKVKIVN